MTALQKPVGPQVPARPEPRRAPPPPAPADEAVQVSARGHVLAGIVMLVVLVGGFGGWATFSRLAGAVVTSGQIEVERNRQVVQHPDGGVVQDILVDEGDEVSAGQVLIRLDGTLLRSDLVVAESQLYELMARRGRLSAERDDATSITFDPELLDVAKARPDVAELVDGQERLFAARLESLQKQTDQLEKQQSQIHDQIRGIEAQQAGDDRQLELIKDQLDDQEKLFSGGLAQKSTVVSLQREEANLTGEVGELIASKAQAEGKITEIEVQILQLGSQRREDAITQLRDMRYQELEQAEKRRSLLEQLSRLDIRAPVSGIVYGLQVHAERSVIKAADPVLYIVPQDRPLIITTRVQTTDIDKVFPGQDVQLRFPTFDARTTPELYGKVSKISADAFTDDKTGATYYRADIELNPGETDRLPGHVHLMPGMPVEAFIRTADHTPMTYFLKPFIDYFNKAFRES